MISKERKVELSNMSTEEMQKANLTQEEKRFIQHNATGTKVIGTSSTTKEERIKGEKSLFGFMFEVGALTKEEYEEKIKSLE